MTKPGFARYNCSIAHASLDSKLRFDRAVAHLSDADEVSEDADISYAEITGDLLTVGWHNHQMTSLEVVDMNGDIVADEAEEGCVDPDEVRGLSARFCAMTPIEQDVLIDDIKAHLCSLIGVHPSEWEPSTEFILEAIEAETSDATLEEMTLALYLATHLSYEMNPSDTDVDKFGGDCDERIRASQGSCERLGVKQSTRGLECPNVFGRRGPRQMVSRRRERSYLNSKSHTPKYRRQDDRHQLPRLLAKEERLMAKMDDRPISDFKDWLEENYFVQQSGLLSGPAYLSVKEQLSFHQEERFDDWLFELESQRCDRDDPIVEPLCMSETRPDDDDWWVHSLDSCDWDRYSDCADENCPDEDPRYPESLFDGFENPYGDRDDIFEDYGDLSELFIGHSSRLRFTGRYQTSRRMMSGIAALG